MLHKVVRYLSFEELCPITVPRARVTFCINSEELCPITVPRAGGVTLAVSFLYLYWPIIAVMTQYVVVISNAAA